MTWSDGALADLAAELGEPLSLDALTGGPGGWRIAQRTAGHRHSSDDVLTAAYALAQAPAAPEALDLGTGIGGVGLLVLWGLGAAARLACVEAQAISYRLLRANLAGNELDARVDAHFGDLRDLALGARFPLVTGSPPYFPVGTGVLPADSQKAHARFELRGDVRDYALAAARHLAPGGVFVFCFPTPQRDRALAAAAAAGLPCTTYRDVVPRAGLAPLFTLFACRASASTFAPPLAEPPLVVRDAAGVHTAELTSIRRRFGF